MDLRISLPAELKDRAEREAAARGLSLPEFVRVSLERAITSRRADDPLFADDAVYGASGPDDTAARHDDYLYEDAS